MLNLPALLYPIRVLL